MSEGAIWLQPTKVVSEMQDVELTVLYPVVLQWFVSGRQESYKKN